MDMVQKAIAAIVIFVLVAVAAYPIVESAADSSLEGENEDPLYSMTARALTDTTVLAVSEGVLTIDGEAVTGMGLTGTVMLMSDVLAMSIDMSTGAYQAWSILLDGQSCTASSTEDPTLVYTFSGAHLTITDTADSTVSLSSWYRYLLVPSSEGSLGVWAISDMPSLALNGDSTFYVTEASGAHAGTVYGHVDNVAAGQNIVDGARAYGSASAVYETILNGTAYSIDSFDAEGGIVGEDSLFVCEKAYTYNTQTGFVMEILLSVAGILILLFALAAIIKVIA